jgi:hypothetical protein
MELAHMKQEPEKGNKTFPTSLPPEPEDKEKYPYGLELHLGHEQLSKLGIEGSPKPGVKLHIEAHGHAQDSHHEAGNPEGRHANIQITHLAMRERQEEAKEEKKEG